MISTGRITATMFLAFNSTVCLGMYHLVQNNILNEGSIRLIFFLQTILFCIVAWWLGKNFDQARDHALRDALTGAFNRRFVDESFPKILAQVDKKRGKLAVMIIDCNDFKMINDTYGHMTGDIVLQKLGKILMDNTRKGDIVARWGGDEFLFVCPQASSVIVQAITERLNAKFQEISKELEIKVSFSMGSAIYPDDARDIDHLIKKADANMYQYKALRK